MLGFHALQGPNFHFKVKYQFSIHVLMLSWWQVFCVCRIQRNYRTQSYIHSVKRFPNTVKRFPSLKITTPVISSIKAYVGSTQKISLNLSKRFHWVPFKVLYRKNIYPIIIIKYKLHKALWWAILRVALISGDFTTGYFIQYIEIQYLSVLYSSYDESWTRKHHFFEKVQLWSTKVYRLKFRNSITYLIQILQGCT